MMCEKKLWLVEALEHGRLIPMWSSSGGLMAYPVRARAIERRNVLREKFPGAQFRVTAFVRAERSQ